MRLTPFALAIAAFCLSPAAHAQQAFTNERDPQLVLLRSDDGPYEGLDGGDIRTFYAFSSGDLHRPELPGPGDLHAFGAERLLETIPRHFGGRGRRFPAWPPEVALERSSEVSLAALDGDCTPSASVLCAGNARFAIRTARLDGSKSTPARARRVGDDSGSFWSSVKPYCRRGSASESATALCESFLEKRLMYYKDFMISREHEKTNVAADRQRVIVRETSKSAAAISTMKSTPKWICRLDRGGRVVCSEAASLLAIYNATVTEGVITSINALVSAGAVTATPYLINKCPTGRWVSLDDPESGDRATIVQLVKDLCENIGRAPEMVESRFRGLNDRGFGGAPGAHDIVGFDPMDGLCLQVSSTSMGEALFNAWLNLSAACFSEAGNEEPDPGGTVSEGASGDLGGPSEDATKVKETTKTENGKTVTTTDWSDGTTTQVETDNNTGVTTVVYIGRPNSSTGGTTSGGYYIESDGKVTHVTRTELDADDNLISYTEYDGDGNVVTREDENGRTTYHPDGQYFHIDPGGNWHIRFCLAGTCYNRTYSKDVIDQLKGAKSCNQVDGTCMSQECREATDTYFNAWNNCQISTDGPTCQSYSSASSCCQESTTGDPTVAMPTPDGGFTCFYGDAEGQSQAEACQTQCSMASSDINCYDECLDSAGGPKAMEFDLLQAACPQMYSDDCFSSDIDFSIPTHDPLDGSPPSPMGLGIDLDPFLLFRGAVTGR